MFAFRYLLTLLCGIVFYFRLGGGGILRLGCGVLFLLVYGYLFVRRISRTLRNVDTSVGVEAVYIPAGTVRVVRYVFVALTRAVSGQNLDVYCIFRCSKVKVLHN